MNTMDFVCIVFVVAHITLHTWHIFINPIVTAVLNCHFLILSIPAAAAGINSSYISLSSIYGKE